jgi:hypothetical protein
LTCNALGFCSCLKSQQDTWITWSIFDRYSPLKMINFQSAPTAGVKVGHNNGESFVTVGGIQMSVKAAAKAGVL